MIPQAIALAECATKVILRWCAFENLYTVAKRLGDSRYLPFSTAPDTPCSNSVALMNLKDFLASDAFVMWQAESIRKHGRCYCVP